MNRAIIFTALIGILSAAMTCDQWKVHFAQYKDQATFATCNEALTNAALYQGIQNGMKAACTTSVYESESMTYLKDLDNEEKATHDPNAKQALTVMGNMASSDLTDSQVAATGATSVTNTCELWYSTMLTWDTTDTFTTCAAA